MRSSISTFDQFCPVINIYTFLYWAYAELTSECNPFRMGYSRKESRHEGGRVRLKQIRYTKKRHHESSHLETSTKKISTNRIPPWWITPGKLPPRKFPPGLFPPRLLNIPTRVFLFLCFSHSLTSRCHWYYLKYCFIILCFKNVEVRNAGKNGYVLKNVSAGTATLWQRCDNVVVDVVITLRHCRI